MLSCGATRLDVLLTRPLNAYHHTPAFVHGELYSGSDTGGFPLSPRPQKSIQLCFLCRASTIRSSLQEVKSKPTHSSSTVWKQFSTGKNLCQGGSIIFF